MDLQSQLDNAIKLHNIDGKSKIGLIFDYLLVPGNGDAWFCLRRLPVFEKVIGKRIVSFVTFEGFEILQSRLSLLEYDDYKYEFYVFDENITRNDIKKAGYCENGFKYDNKIFYDMPFNANSYSGWFLSMKGSSKSKNTELRTARYPELDRDYYIEKYKIIPGKTYWIIPHATHCLPFPSSFWNGVGALLKSMGFAVVYNTTDSSFDGIKAYVPFVDCVRFAELCGHVIGTRTGLFDFIADAKAEMIIYSPENFAKNFIVDWNIDNTDWHIRQSIYPTRSNYLTLPEFKYFSQINKNFVEYVFELSLNKHCYCIFILSKDAHCPSEPNINSKRLRVLNKTMGLKCNFEKTYRHSYIGIIDRGEVVIEKSSPNERVIYTYEFAENKAELLSEGFNVCKSDKVNASCSINGVEYSINSRGLNFVVYDYNKNRVVSFCTFDTYTFEMLQQNTYLRALNRK